MKKMMVLSLLLTIVSLSSCTISTNNKDKIYNKEFKIEIKNTYNSKDKKTFKNQKENEMELEEFARYGITIYVPDEIYKSFDYNYNNTCNKHISFDYNNDNIDIFFKYSSNFNRTIYYDLYVKNLFESESITISTKFIDVQLPEEYKIDFTCREFNFEKSGYITPTLDLFSGHFNKFKEMVDSIEYYDLPESFTGLDGETQVKRFTNLGSNYSKAIYYFDYDLDENKYKYDLGYLSYFTDSIYYPALFDSSKGNVMGFNADISYKFNPFDINGKNVMSVFDIYSSVIDPGCTHPKNPLRSMHFTAVDLNSKYDENNLSSYYDTIPYILSRQYLISKKYSDKFLNYKIGDLDIKIILLSKENIYACFESGPYLYNLGAKIVY